MGKRLHWRLTLRWFTCSISYIFDPFQRVYISIIIVSSQRINVSSEIVKPFMGISSLDLLVKMSLSLCYLILKNKILKRSPILNFPFRIKNFSFVLSQQYRILNKQFSVFLNKNGQVRVDILGVSFSYVIIP